MSLDVIFQLGSILFVVTAGPLVIILLAARGGNLSYLPDYRAPHLGCMVYWSQVLQL
jgi:hypothetical protein